MLTVRLCNNDRDRKWQQKCQYRERERSESRESRSGPSRKAARPKQALIGTRTASARAWVKKGNAGPQLSISFSFSALQETLASRSDLSIPATLLRYNCLLVFVSKLFFPFNFISTLVGFFATPPHCSHRRPLQTHKHRTRSISVYIYTKSQ